MAEFTVSPPVFNKKSKRSPAEWLRQFQNYVAFRNVSDEQEAKLFKVLMIEQAADWIDSLLPLQKDKLPTWNIS